jgi:hypothetical protein
MTLSNVTSGWINIRRGSVIPNPFAAFALIKQDGSSVFRIEKPLCETRESSTRRASPSLILRLLRWQLLFVVRHAKSNRLTKITNSAFVPH